MSRRPVKSQSRKSSQGFTLVELLVTVAVIGILAVVATPSMTALVGAYRVSSTASELTAAMQIARSEAVRRNARVRVCGNAACTSTDYSQAVVVHGAPTAQDPAVIRAVAAGSGVTVTGPANGIVFRPSGVIDAVQCLPASNSYAQYAVRVTLGGAVSNEKGGC